MKTKSVRKSGLFSSWDILMIISVALVLISVYFPDMGENILKYKLIKGISYVLLGFSLLMPMILRSLQEEATNTLHGRPRQESLEEMMENGTGHISMKSVLRVVLGIILLFAGLKTGIACVRDAMDEPVWVKLESARVEAARGTENYELMGLANGEEYIFRLEGKEMYENLMKKINYQVPEIIVVYYPHSKAIIQVQIYFDDEERLVLPQGDRAYDRRSLEKLPEGKGEAIEDNSKYASTTGDTPEVSLDRPTAVPGTYGPKEPVYSEVALEELNLPEVIVGADFMEVVQVLTNLPEGECYETMLFTSDIDMFMEYMKNVATAKMEYEVAEDLGCDILYRENVELILVYNKDSFVIEAAYARRWKQ